ncbi:MAG: hypothetical protein K9N35_07980 [Candidatus Marinimicrobia bacterium]|nr:hypothetical protein [Candidatus Neomarinimicrobiota bacterium]
MKFDIDYRKSYLELKTHGDADVESFLRLHREMCDVDNWKPGIPILMDHSDVTASQLSRNDIQILAEDLGQYSDIIGASRFAFLVPTDLEYGMVRMWMTFVEEKWHGTAKVFRSKEPALRWLSV